MTNIPTEILQKILDTLDLKNQDRNQPKYNEVKQEVADVIDEFLIKHLKGREHTIYIIANINGMRYLPIRIMRKTH